MLDGVELRSSAAAQCVSFACGQRLPGDGSLTELWPGALPAHTDRLASSGVRIRFIVTKGYHTLPYPVSGLANAGCLDSLQVIDCMCYLGHACWMDSWVDP